MDELSMSFEMRHPLRGVRVLDLTHVLAGPFCTMILGDLGADVVKVERPDVGDDARCYEPLLMSGVSAYFASLNRGKKSVILDLKSESGRTTLTQLAERADVLVENFRPGKLEALGLSPKRLRRLNPRLIHTAASGFGRGDQDLSAPAYDIIIQAMSGLMSITGHNSNYPVRTGISLSDIVTGLFMSISILAALRARDRLGRGCELDLAMLDCTVSTLENALSRFSTTGETPEPLGTRHPSITPFQSFPTADTQIVVAAGNNALWTRLCNVLDCPSLVLDERFATNQARTTNHEALGTQLTSRFVQQRSVYWLDRLETEGVPAAPIRTVDQVARDPNLLRRKMLHRMIDPSGEEFVTAGCPIQIDGAPPDISNRAPALGEHTEQVLKEWLG